MTRDRPKESGYKRVLDGDVTELSASKRLRRQDDRSGYQASTRETKAAWEELLNNLSAVLSDEEQSALHEAAEETMRIMKDPTVREIDKKREVESVLGLKVTDEYFTRILRLSQKLTDYHLHEADEPEMELGEDEGACALVEEDDDMHDDDNQMDDAEEEGDGISKAVQDEPDADMKGTIDAKAIDDSWIQRQMPKLSETEEATESQKRADSIFDQLSKFDLSEQALQNTLAKLFKYSAMAAPFLELCVANREKIVYCMRMARAKGQERDRIRAELEQQPFGHAIISELETEVVEADGDKNFREIVKGEKAKREGAAEAMRMQQQYDIPELNDLAFEEGARIMSKRKIDLPEGSVHSEKRGYQEYHIPPYKRAAIREEDEKPIRALPGWARDAFGDIPSLNVVQTRCFNCAFERDDNMLLCAPTGAGKTNVAMLTVLHEISKCANADGTLDPDELQNIKIVYIAPMKALVQEVVGTFGKRLAPYGLRVSELTGDSNMSTGAINASQMIVSTPEKWDIITRKSGEKTHMESVKLMLIDEIHLLHDTRGPILEAIVARTIRMMEETQRKTRLVGLSATLPNYKDVAHFMRVKASDNPAENGLMYFDASFRPIPLEQQYIGITEKKQLKRRAIMNELVYDKVMQVSGSTKQQTMIFVHSRKDTAATARALRDKALEQEELGRIISDEGTRKEHLAEMAEQVKDPHLRNIMPYGFGIHHAGLSRDDREIVEDLFRREFLRVLVCTATLAWGVNLPAYCVIIKGTQIYNPEKGRWMELSTLDVMQMIGRAGRRDMKRNIEDQKGLGIIITSDSELPFYLSLLNHQLPIESHFISKLTDQLNAEIVMGSINDNEEAVRWLGYTYLYIRMMKNPSLYRITDKKDKTLQVRRQALVHKAACTLEKHGLAKYERRTGAFMSTDLGRVASYYYLTVGTIAKFNEHLSPTMHEIDILRLFAMADEFKYMSVREEEKLELAKLLDTVPVPVKEDMDNPLAKVNVLLQAYISQRKLEGFSIMSDMVYIKQSATRILRAMHEIVLKRGWAGLSDKLLNLSKMVEKRLWLSQSPLRQFDKLAVSDLQRLERKNISWDRFLALGRQDVVELVGSASEGQKIHRHIHKIPKMSLEPAAKPITRSLLRVELVIVADFIFDKKVHGTAETFHVIVEDPDGEQILHHEPFILREASAEEEHVLYFYVPMYDPVPPQYFIKIVSDRWLWSETTVPLSFAKLELPEKAAPHTELLDTSPHLISVLNNKRFEALYPKMKQLNPIQTQVFQSLMNTNDNVLVCAPSGSGKTLCGEIALLRLIATAGLETRAVYVAPKQDMVDRVYKDWSVRFEQLGQCVRQLTGETTTDLQLMKEGNIVCATAKQWDVMSRKWSKRATVQRVRLYIVDELHHLDTREGPTVEVIASRMRFISSQKGCENRIVGLAHSLLYAREVGRWIGATDATTFNFHPTARPVPLEIRMRTFDQPGFAARTLSMYKPTYLAITQQTEGPVIVFVPSKRITYDMVIELVHHCNADAVNNRRFLHVDPEKLKDMFDSITNKTLRRSIEYGIGFYDLYMSKTDEKILSTLFEQRAVQVVVCPYDLAYRVSVRASMVILAGTQYYDGKEHRHVDYYISDMLEMLGKAGVQGVDDTALAYVMCYTPKKEALKKILYEPYPIESQLDACFIDHLCAEIAGGTVVDKQGAVDYLTHTFLYKRLRQNPNYYGMPGTAQGAMNEFLSTLVEDSVETLVEAGCIEENDDDDEDVQELEAANLGSIAAHYYLTYTTIERFASSVESKTKLRKLIEILSSASEFENLVIRHKEEGHLERLARHSGIKQKDLKYDDPHTKASLLLHAHFSRKMLTSELEDDLKHVLPTTLPLVAALVDVVQSSRWLAPLLSCMELSQMIVQGMWDNDSLLLQLPHVTKQIAKEWETAGVEGVQDMLELEDDKREQLMKGFSSRQVSAIAATTNSFPDIAIAYKVLNQEVHEGGRVALEVVLTREDAEEDKVPEVKAPLFPRMKKESWWLVVGEKKDNVSYVVKSISLKGRIRAVLEFDAPAQGKHDMCLFLMCDSYLGCDQEEAFVLDVKEPEDSEDDEEDEEMEEAEK